MARLSRRLWGGTSLKTAAKEATVKFPRVSENTFTTGHELQTET